ncbi:unnamed protein product [Gordionus sp. m RMFG-2023]
MLILTIQDDIPILAQEAVVSENNYAFHLFKMIFLFSPKKLLSVKTIMYQFYLFKMIFLFSPKKLLSVKTIMHQFHLFEMIFLFSPKKLLSVKTIMHQFHINHHSIFKIYFF